ncbi:MAG: hypothetical protein GQ574_22650 [Crocinitomix sp.]|nr:hypothetical protein [Crocinitomix sp.]
MELHQIASASITVISVIVTLVLGFRSEKVKIKRIICDGFQIQIKGEFIRVTEDELTQPLDYCTQTCKKKNLSMDRIKFGKIN